MKNKLSIIAPLFFLTSAAMAQTGTWSGAEFIQKSETNIVVLNTLKSYDLGSKFPVTLDLDAFAGYSVKTQYTIGGFAIVFNHQFTNKLSLGLGLGNKTDLGNKFQFSDIKVSNTGFIVSATYKF